jgi:hypothetical protein
VLRSGALVHDEPLPAGGRPPVDRTDAIPGDEVADVRVLDPVALDARDLATRERLRLDGRKDAPERDLARVRLQLVASGHACFPHDEPERVACADHDLTELEDAPASAPEREVQLTLAAGSDAQRTEGAVFSGHHARRQVEQELESVHGAPRPNREGGRHVLSLHHPHLVDRLDRDSSRVPLSCRSRARLRTGPRG